jgi:hypothetical protein
MFYVYEHWRPDTNQCFYVGKGIRNKGKPSRAFQMGKGRNRYHQSVVRKLKIRDQCVEVRIIFESTSEEEVYAKEIERIAYWRELGVRLTNLADGGGRNAGWKQTEERRKAIGDSKRGNKYRLGAILSDETKKKISESNKGKTYSDEYKSAMAIACAGEKNGFYGKKHTSEVGAKVAEANRRRVWTDESRAKLSASLKSRPKGRKRTKTWTHTEETKARMRAAQAKRAEERRAENAARRD